MAFIDNIISGIKTNKIGDTAHHITERIRICSQLRLIRNAMSKDNDMMDKAYQALGRQFYKKMTEEEKKEYGIICDVIETSKTRLQRAHKRYLEISGSIKPEDIEINENITEDEIDSLIVADSNTEYNPNINTRETSVFVTDTNPSDDSSETPVGDSF